MPCCRPFDVRISLVVAMARQLPRSLPDLQYTKPCFSASCSLNSVSHVPLSHPCRPFHVRISLVVAMARQLLRSLPDLDRQRLLQNQSQSHEGLWLELSQGGGGGARGQAGGSAAKPQPQVLRQKMSM